MSALVLYHALFSTCSQKVRFVLGQKRIAYESRPVSLQAGEHLQDWYLAINPNGVVPSLADGGRTIIDSSVIIEYLDEIWPDPKMTPNDAIERAAMRSWMRYFEEVPTAAIRVPSFNKVFAGMVTGRGETVNKPQRARMPLRKAFYDKMGPNGFDQSITAESEEKLRSCLCRVDSSLAKRGPFLLGDQVSLADVVLLPTIARMDDLGMSSFWSDLPSVPQWYNKMQAQPGFAEAYPPGARLSAPAAIS